MFLSSLTPDFVEISQVRDAQVREAKLRNQVMSRIIQPIETMERDLGRLGLQPVRAVLSLQTPAPPAALGRSAVRRATPQSRRKRRPLNRRA